MAWRLASRLARFRAIEDAPIATTDEPIFPAGVVALGRGGAGEVGALLRADGVYIGLLHLDVPTARDTHTIDDLADTLPVERCQILTIRWPIDAERAAARQTVKRPTAAGAALARQIGDDYLPTLVGAGWSAVHSYLTIEGDDPEAVLHDLHETAARIPVPSRAATLAEAKQIAGDWYTPCSQGLITIGWSLTELTAEPHHTWAAQLLELPALTGLPTMLTLHLEPVGAPAPISLELHRRLAAIDGEIEARRRAGRRGGSTEDDDADDLLAERRELLATLAASGGEDERPRAARLLIACTVEPEGARALRSDVESALRRCGFLATSFGPGRSDEMLLSCAPLHAPQLGRSLMLTQRGAALLAPIAPAMARDGDMGHQGTRLPLGLRRDGAALYTIAGESLLVVGTSTEPVTPIQTWALGRIAAGAQLIVVDTDGGWRGISRIGGGAVVQVALELGALLADLSAARPRQAGDEPTHLIAQWADQLVRLLSDLCPDLGEDECGDLTAALMAMAEAEFAWGEPVQLGALIEQLRQSGTGPAQHLATVLTATGGLYPARRQYPADSSLTIYDATPESSGQQVTSEAGCVAVALRAALDHLEALPSEGRHSRVLIIDDLAALGWSSAAPGLLGQLFAVAAARGIATWCAASSLAAAPRPLTETLRALAPTALLLPGGDEATRIGARALALPPAAIEQYQALDAGELLLVRGDTATPLRSVPLRLPPYALRR